MGNYNDLQTASWKRYKIGVGDSVDTDIFSGVGARIHMVNIATASASERALGYVYNAASAAGDDYITISCWADGDNVSLNFGPNGTKFDVGVTLQLSGASSELEIYYTDL
jgi:hypothetical protein